MVHRNAVVVGVLGLACLVIALFYGQRSGATKEAFSNAGQVAANSPPQKNVAPPPGEDFRKGNGAKVKDSSPAGTSGFDPLTELAKRSPGSDGKPLAEAEEMRPVRQAIQSLDATFDPDSRPRTQRWLTELVKRLAESKGNPLAEAEEMRRVRQAIQSLDGTKVRWSFPCSLLSDGEQAEVVVEDVWFLCDFAGMELPLLDALRQGCFRINYDFRSETSKELPRPPVARVGHEISRERFLQLRNGDLVVVQGNIRCQLHETESIASALGSSKWSFSLHIKNAKLVGDAKSMEPCKP